MKSNPVEPVDGSVVLDRDGFAWQRGGDGWRAGHVWGYHKWEHLPHPVRVIPDMHTEEK